MGITAFIVERKIVAYFFIFLFLVGGTFGFYWNAMAASIMGGLGLGAMLTVILYPTVYATLHNIKEPGGEATGPTPELAAAPAE